MKSSVSLQKHIKKLQQKKYRDECSEFVVENPLIIRDALEKDSIPREVLVTDQFRNNHPDIVTALQHKMSTAALDIEQGVVEKISSLETPQGIIAVYDKTEEVIDDSLPIVFLNGVSDPSNVGAIMRSCAAFGIATVISDVASADPFNPKAISAAKESIFLLHIARKPESFVHELGSRMPVYALDAHHGTALPQFEWQRPFCLIIGSEAHGISENVTAAVSANITIPLDQDRVESLNVAAATAIALHASFEFQQRQVQ